MLLYITVNMYQNYNRIPCFVEKKIPKQQLKSMVHRNKVCGFLLQVHTTPLIFLSKTVSKNFPYFPKLFPFWTIPNLLIMIKTDKI